MAVRLTHAPEADEIVAESRSLGRALLRRFGFNLLGGSSDVPEQHDMPRQRTVDTRRPCVAARSTRPIEEHLQLSLLSRGYPAMPRF
jgi:hypothetical protein